MTKNTSFPYTDFVPVRSKRRRGNWGKQEGISPIVLLRGLRDELEADKWFAQCKRPCTDFFSFSCHIAYSWVICVNIEIIDESLRHLKMDFTGVICLGLGSPSSSHNARVQLAFLLEICDHLLIVCAWLERVQTNHSCSTGAAQNIHLRSYLLGGGSVAVAWPWVNRAVY